MNDVEAALSMTGIATKAGKTINGSENCQTAIKRRKAFLLLVAEDASPRTIEPLQILCGHYSVPVRILGDREQLGRVTGKDNRAAVAIIDNGLATRIIEILDGVSISKPLKKTHRGRVDD